MIKHDFQYNHDINAHLVLNMPFLSYPNAMYTMYKSYKYQDQITRCESLNSNYRKAPNFQESEAFLNQTRTLLQHAFRF
jgi:uncharacterized membrane protein YkgB